MRKLLLASAAAMGATIAMSGGAKAQPVKPVAAGTLVVHLNGYLQFQLAGFGSTYNTVKTPIGAYKLNPISSIGEVRLYPGFDAQTRNGLDFGAQVELRTNYSDAGQGINKTTGSGSSAGTSSLYVRRAYAYLGTPVYGFVRLGQTDSAFSLLQDGVIEAFGDGAQWPGDGTTVSLLPTAATPSNFIYADTGNLYATDKVVFITPAFAGFSAMAGYEPNSNGVKEGYGNDATASSTSSALSASPTTGDIGKRRKNTVDAMVQYSLKANGFVVKASAGYLFGAPIAYDGAPVAASSPDHLGYDNLQVFQAGGQVTYAGATLGVNLKGCQVEDGYAFKPKGARDALSYVISGNYVIGQFVVGASYWNGQSAGAYSPTLKIARTLSEYGFAAGANYVVSPNLSLFVQYLYGHRHQPGATQTSPDSAGPKLSQANTQVNAIGLGATLKW